MKNKERIENIITWFKANMPVVETELHYENNFQLLVAVILSAQCTDKRVNQITPVLFKSYPDCETMAAATVEAIFEHIKSCSYPNNKAKHLSAMSKMLFNEFNGEIPSDIDQMQLLPGVGRKTANVIASVAFNKPAMAVDTHVFRVAARLGLTKNAKNPLEAEKQLVAIFDESDIPRAHHWLILHGRYVCIARKPKCVECGLKEFCPYFKEIVKKQ
ncbi:MAG: endonuclease III [Salinivirgaceae bacterium]|nr:endonuclease III [Salinivirgaceae bacterium]